uniref:dynamin family protein n=1 Tax=Virgibacillus salexigens TaxID=61016 RepID=UPI003081EE47
AALYQKILDNKHTKRGKKILDLYDKYKMQELMFCCAGHFSAGKSSMINALFGKEILPNSPIPTSANIVKVMSGNGTVRVFYHHEQPVEYQEPYDMDMVKQYSTVKDTIRKVEMRASQELL